MKVSLIDTFFEFESPSFNDIGRMAVEGELFWTMFALELDSYWSAQGVIGTDRLRF